MFYGMGGGFGGDMFGMFMGTGNIGYYLLYKELGEGFDATLEDGAANKEDPKFR